METTVEKRMRRRMILIKSEQERLRKARFNTTFTPVKSFDEIREEREASYIKEQDSDDERDESCNASLVSECVSEMRRRRIYEMTHGRPYPSKSTKAKPTFWQPENRAPVLISPSERSNRSILSVPTPLDSKSVSSVSSGRLMSSKKKTARVLWKDLEQPSAVEGDTEDEQVKDSFMNDEIIDGFNDEDDEIMTPVRIKKVMDMYDNIKNQQVNRGEIASLVTSLNLNEEVSPNNNAATVTEISEATRALSAFVTSAVDVMKEAKTPEKDLTSKPVWDCKAIEPRVLSQNTVTKRLAATPFSAAKQFFQERVLSAAMTPSNNLVSKASTPATANTAESSIGEAEIMITKLDHQEDFHAEYGGILWPSLFYNEDCSVGETSSCPVDTVTKTMLEALVEGGALQPDIDGKNILKLFVDMYQRQTFEKIVNAVQALTGLHSLVICRAIDKSRPTYRTDYEMKAIFEATKYFQELDSLLLLNFTPESMSDLTLLAQSHQSLFRLQIQMTEGTLDDEILSVMSTSPKLTHVVLELSESCAVGNLLKSKSIESIRINSKNLVLKKSHIRSLISNLQTNICLTTLDLAPAITVEDFQSLCSTLKDNYRLESLRVNLKLKTDVESTIASMELANMFRENSFLINVWNYASNSCPISEASKCDLVAALRTNKSMEEFKFFSEDLLEWKNASGGNPSWLEENLNMNSNTTLSDNSTIFGDNSRMQSREDESFISVTSSVDINRSHRGDNDFVLADCGFESSDLRGSICGFDCNDVSEACAGMKHMGTKFHHWASATTESVKRKTTWA